jgi:hypothetical protein
MAKDEKGHGSEKRGGGQPSVAASRGAFQRPYNYNRSDAEKFPSGAAAGDHQAAQTPNAGHGSPVTMHTQKSVGTHPASGGGGGGGGGGSNGGGNSGGLTRAAKERIKMRMDADQKHFPSGKAGSVGPGGGMQTK